MPEIILPNAEQIRHIYNVLNDDKIIMGAYWDKSSDPKMTRTDASIGLEARIGKDGELVRNDFDYMPIYCDMGEVVDDYGNVFIKIPKFYIQRFEGKDFKIVRISKHNYPGFYLPWCFRDFENNRELDYVLIGKYKANLSDDRERLESKPDRHPLVGRTILQFRSLARANNDEANGLKGYQLFDIHAWDIINALFTVEFATLDSQSVALGFTTGQLNNNHKAVVSETQTNRIIIASSHANEYRVGQSIGIGYGASDDFLSGGPRLITHIAPYDDENTAIYFDGEPIDIEEGDIIANRGWINGFSRNIASSSGYIVENDGKYPFSYRGIESLWGDIWQFVDGVNINDHQAWVAKNAEDYTSNVFAAPYEKLSYINHDENGYVKEMGYDPNHPYAQFPVEVGGGPSTYYADYYYQNTGQCIARVGGSWDFGSAAGLSYWHLRDSSSYASVTAGGRLLKKSL